MATRSLVYNCISAISLDLRLMLCTTQSLIVSLQICLILDLVGHLIVWLAMKKTIALLLAAAMLVFLLLFRIVVVSGSSMHDTLVHGDYVLLMNNIF